MTAARRKPVPLRWTELWRAARILGFIPDNSVASNFQLRKLLVNRIKAGKVRQLKRGSYVRTD
jgi:hypothetical protein